MMKIQVLVMLTAGEGGLPALRDYEYKVAPILREYGGELITAFMPLPTNNAPQVDEVHLLEFPSMQVFEMYRQDRRIAELSDVRGKAIAKTVIYMSSEFLEY